jgi:hypothetical protein
LPGLSRRAAREALLLVGLEHVAERKLGDDPADPRYISNEPGVGYRLLEPAP